MTTSDQEPRTTDDEAPREGVDAEEQVGFGRVVRDGRAGLPADDVVDEASEDSFPASDPPGYLPKAPTPADPARTEPVAGGGDDRDA